ncbi:hypothetical protein HDV06_006758 [Boothiomyces sp. JEL0866]|nr:hypothetical protein HDV06_006758 [Boothiomyces sp. JEL0866]
MAAKEEFMQITGADEKTAEYFLEAAKGDLQSALSTFFEGSASSGAAQTHQTSTSHQSPPPKQSRIKTFSDFNNDDEEEEDDQKMYAGGEKSGIAVKGPKKDPQNVIKDILDQAAKGGVKEEVAEKKPKYFSGAGQRLGSDAVPSEVIQPAPTNPELEPVSRTLTFWQDGFSVEDGPLLRYDDPQNQELLNAIKSGRAPTSLLNVANNQPVEVKVAHRMQEKYVPPPKKPMAAFAGAGNRLGSIVSSAPSVPGAFPTQSSQSAPAPQAAEVDPSQPVTSIQVRLGDGKRLIAKFNQSHTVGDLRAYVRASTTDPRDFVLQTSMPTTIIHDDKLSLKDAQLLNAVIIQRYV